MDNNDKLSPDTAWRLAGDLLRAKSNDNPDAPLPMVRSGCAMPLAEALYALGWRNVMRWTAPVVSSEQRAAWRRLAAMADAATPGSHEWVTSRNLLGNVLDAADTLALLDALDAALGRLADLDQIRTSPGTTDAEAGR